MNASEKRSRGIYLAILCVLTYGVVYLCRINISAAVEKMAAGFGTSVAAVGIFGSLQSLIYACGQFVNGYFINRGKSSIIIGVAAFGSGLVNLLMGLVDGFVPALILWCINAYLQSLFWGAIIRTLSTYPESRSSRTLMCLIMIIPVCTIISWSVIGAALDKVNDWHPYFMIPGIILLLFAPLWLSLHKVCPEADSLQAEQEKRSVREMFRYFLENGVVRHCVVSLIHGAISGGVFFWAPVMISRILTGTDLSPYLMAAIIPFIKIPSSLLLPVVTGKHDYRRLLQALFGGIAVLCMASLLFSHGSNLLFLILIILMTFLSNLIGSLMSLYVPLEYSDDNMGAPVAGVLDAVIYIGSSISTYLLGSIISSNDLNGAVVIWLIAASAAFFAELKTGFRFQGSGVREK